MKNIIAKSYDYLFALLLVVVPLSKAAPNIVIALIALCFIIDFKSIDFKPLKKLPVVLFYSFMVYFFTKAAITGSLFTEWSVYKKYIILFFIPVLFLKVKNTGLVKAGVVTGVTISILATLALAARYYFSNGTLPFANGEVVNTLLLLERPYAGFFAVAGAVFSLDLIGEYPKYKKLLVACSLAAVAFIIIIAARISFITLILLALLYILFYLRGKAQVKLVFVGVFFALTAIVFVFSKNITERFFVKESVEVALDYEPRIVIWPCAVNVMQRDDFNPVVGYPNNKMVENRLVDCYTTSITNNQSKNDYFRSERFNTHNQFLDLYLTAGILGLCLFLAFLVTLFLQVRTDFAYTAVLVAIVLFLLVENVLHRQMGCYIFSIFGALLMMRKPVENDKN